LLRSEKRMDAAIAVAYYLVCDGIWHDDSVHYQRTGRCLMRGVCRHCYPHNFPPAVAR
jgi:hypothetical protein